MTHMYKEGCLESCFAPVSADIFIMTSPPRMGRDFAHALLPSFWPGNMSTACRYLHLSFRFLEMHKEWRSLRDRQSSSMDEHMTILPGVFPVGCKLASESASFTAGDDGLRAVDEALSRQTSVVLSVPPSWVAARRVVRGR